MELYDEELWKEIAKEIYLNDDFKQGKPLYARDFLPQLFICDGRDQILQYIRMYEADIFVEVLIEIGRDIAFVPVKRGKQKDILIKFTDMYGYKEDET